MSEASKATSVSTTTHKRLRPFNTRNTLCQAVVARGTMVFLRGQPSQGLETRKSLHAGDPGNQAAKVKENVKLLLEAVIGRLEHIGRIVVYVTDIRYPVAVYREMGKWLTVVDRARPGWWCQRWFSPGDRRRDSSWKRQVCE